MVRSARQTCFSETKNDLQHARPKADDDIINDLPNEYGAPNHRPDPNQPYIENHQSITNRFHSANSSSTATCEDWKSVAESGSKPRAGHSWPQSTGSNAQKQWITTFSLWGCAAGLYLTEASKNGTPDVYTIDNGGGYDGFYCFALTP